MSIRHINENSSTADVEGKHLVVNCRTGDVFAADTMEEAQALAEDHQKETEALAKKAVANGHS